MKECTHGFEIIEIEGKKICIMCDKEIKK